MAFKKTIPKGDRPLYVDPDAEKPQLKTDDQIFDMVKYVKLTTASDLSAVYTAVPKPPQGTEVVLFVGPTGAGKTSTIQSLAEASYTNPASQGSDTKVPLVIQVEVKGRRIWCVDTAGMCDTSAEDDSDAERALALEECLIKAAAGVLIRNGYMLKRVYVTLGKSTKLSARLKSVWPMFESSLKCAPNDFDSITRFLITMVNKASKKEKHMSALYENGDALKQVVKAAQQANWASTILCGDENMDALEADMIESMTASKKVPCPGEGGRVPALQATKRKRMEIETWEKEHKALMNALLGPETTLASLQESQAKLRKQLDKSNKDLENARSSNGGCCSSSNVDIHQKTIRDFKGTLTELAAQEGDTQADIKAKKQKTANLVANIDEKRKDVARDERMGSVFDMVLGGVNQVARLLNK